jgi:hypothetical protein
MSTIVELGGGHGQVITNNIIIATAELQMHAMND